MAHTSYFRERARNPYLKPRAPTPSFEDDPGLTPTLDQPARQMSSEVIERPDMRAVLLGPPPGAGIPGGERAGIPGMPAPAPETTPPPRDPIEDARAEYEAKVPQGFGGRLKDALLTAGLGFLQGAARDPNNPIAAGLGGAATGGVISAINPRLGRGIQFETMERPRIEDQTRREEERRKKQQAEEDRARAISMDTLKRQDIEAGIGVQQAQKTKLLTPETRAGTPFQWTQTGILNTQTGQIMPHAVPPQKPPTRDELTIEPTSGKSFEQIARDSYEARGGDAYVRSKLPPWMRQVLEKGTMMTEEGEAQASPEEIQQAQRALDDSIKRQWEADLQYTRGDVRSRALGARKGASGQTRGAKAPQSGISRPRSQFNSKNFPGLKFD